MKGYKREEVGFSYNSEEIYDNDTVNTIGYKSGERVEVWYRWLNWLILINRSTLYSKANMQFVKNNLGKFDELWKQNNNKLFRILTLYRNYVF